MRKIIIMVLVAFILGCAAGTPVKTFTGYPNIDKYKETAIVHFRWGDMRVATDILGYLLPSSVAVYVNGIQVGSLHGPADTVTVRVPAGVITVGYHMGNKTFQAEPNKEYMCKLVGRSLKVYGKS